MLRNGAPLGHLSHQRKWGSREKRSHNFWPFSSRCRLPLINQTEGPQRGKERGLSWPYLSFGLSLDKIAGLQIQTGGVTLSPTEWQYGNMVIKYDLIIQPTHMASHPFLCANPTGLQHGTSCMIRSLRSFQFRMEVEDIWEQNTLKSKIYEQRLREIM